MCPIVYDTSSLGLSGLKGCKTVVAVVSTICTSNCDKPECFIERSIPADEGAWDKENQIDDGQSKSDGRMLRGHLVR